VKHDKEVIMFIPFNYQQLKSLSYTDGNALSGDPDSDPDDIKGDHYVDDSLIRWMTEGTNPNMPPRSDCG
jgi:hypothetical protein